MWWSDLIRRIKKTSNNKNPFPRQIRIGHPLLVRTQPGRCLQAVGRVAREPQRKSSQNRQFLQPKASGQGNFHKYQVFGLKVKRSVRRDYTQCSNQFERSSHLPLAFNSLLPKYKYITLLLLWKSAHILNIYPFFFLLLLIFERTNERVIAPASRDEILFW